MLVVGLHSAAAARPCRMRIKTHSQQALLATPSNMHIGPAHPRMRACPCPCISCAAVLQLVTLGDANDINDMRTITKMKGGSAAHCCCWSRDGKYVLAAGDCGTVKLVDVGHKNSKVRCAACTQ